VSKQHNKFFIEVSLATCLCITALANAALAVQGSMFAALMAVVFTLLSMAAFWKAGQLYQRLHTQHDPGFVRQPHPAYRNATYRK
jgi:hypothetical protein